MNAFRSFVFICILVCFSFSSKSYAAASVKSSASLDFDDLEDNNTNFVQTSNRNTVKSLLFNKKTNIVSSNHSILAKVVKDVSSFANSLKPEKDLLLKSPNGHLSFIQKKVTKANSGLYVQFGSGLFAILFIIF